MEATESKHLTANTREGGGDVIALTNNSAGVPTSIDKALNAGSASIAEIDRLMGDLLIARDYLHSEGERLRRLTANYAHLANTASASVRIISESMGKWHNPDSALAVVAPSPSPAADAQG